MIVSAFFAEDMSAFVTDVHILSSFAIATCRALLIISAHDALIFVVTIQVYYEAELYRNAIPNKIRMPINIHSLSRQPMKTITANTSKMANIAPHPSPSIIYWAIILFFDVHLFLYKEVAVVQYSFSFPTCVVPHEIFLLCHSQY